MKRNLVSSQLIAINKLSMKSIVNTQTSNEKLIKILFFFSNILESIRNLEKVASHCPFSFLRKRKRNSSCSQALMTRKYTDIYTKGDVQQLCHKAEHYWECHIH